MYPVETDSTVAKNRSMAMLADGRRRREMDAQFVKRSEFDALRKLVDEINARTGEQSQSKKAK